MFRPYDEITSPANPRVKNLIALRRRRIREQVGQTLVEGIAEFGLALEAGVRPREVYICPDLAPDPDALEALAAEAATAGARVFVMNRSAFEKAAYREGPDGMLAIVPSVSRSVTDLDLPANPLVLLAEGIEKPGNMGAMLRTADAAGVDAVIAVDPVTDWGNPNVVRSSKGTVFSVPVATGTRAEVLAWCTERGLKVYAATPHTDVLHTDVSYDGPTAIAVGAENPGLTTEFMAAAERIKIPMVGVVNSLNVATSAAVVLYEAVRQRG